jgi:hypothetical protein
MAPGASSTEQSNEPGDFREESGGKQKIGGTG